MDWRDRHYYPPGWVACIDSAKLIHDDVVVHCERIVCPGCDGKGSCSNPSIDRHGIGQEEWNEWEEDERQMYRTGGYDVICPWCKGLRVVLTPNDDDPNKAIYEADEREMNEDESERDSERRMGA